MILIYVLYNVFIVQKLYIKSIYKDTSYTYKKDIQELIFKESLYFGYNPMVLE